MHTQLKFVPATFQVLNSHMCMGAAASEQFQTLVISQAQQVFPPLEANNGHTEHLTAIDDGPGFPFSVMFYSVNCDSLLFPETNQDE